MFIRQTRTRTVRGRHYYTKRLVQSERIGSRVRQRTLLNLGTHFPIDPSDWTLLCQRLEQILYPSTSMVVLECTPQIEREAQRIAAQLLIRSPQLPAATDFQTIDVDSLDLLRPRSVGVEQVALWAFEQLGLNRLFQQLRMNRSQRMAATGLIIARMAVPGSELSSWQWLQEHSGLGELLQFDFETMSLMQLYRASDLLMKHQAAIEQHLFTQVTDLFSLKPTVTLYDLTNTYLEGQAKAQPKAQRGRSKEKRSDCKLLTLGLVLDGSGFVRRSQVFAGNVSEAGTLETMLEALEAPQQALVVMDAGIAKQYNLNWLREQDYRYVVVSAQRKRQFEPDQAQLIRTRTQRSVELYPEIQKEQGEVRLYCRSASKTKQELKMNEQFREKFEAGLQKLHDGLSRPRTHKKLTSVWSRIGRLQQNSRGVCQHYDIEVVPDPKDETKAKAIHWQRQDVEASKATHPGVYGLRTNVMDWEAERLWRTYNLLTDLEAVFRSFKSELGLRPIYHQTQIRADGHLFITVLAYQLVQTIRRHLRQHAERSSWSRLRRILSGQLRVTARFRGEDGQVLHVRKATKAEPAQQRIYEALDINPSPGGIKKLRM